MTGIIKFTGKYLRNHTNKESFMLMLDSISKTSVVEGVEIEGKESVVIILPDESKLDEFVFTISDLKNPDYHKIADKLFYKLLDAINYELVFDMDDFIEKEVLVYKEEQ